jgi:superfamily I DNA and RNA helicase
MPTSYGLKTLIKPFGWTKQTILPPSQPTRAWGRSLLVSVPGTNYRSPETIARYIQRVLPFDFLPSNPLPGLGVGAVTYKAPEDQSKRVAAIITNLVRTGFRHSDIVILSMRGLARATFAHEKRIGSFTLSRPTGEYDLLGNQLFEGGQLRFDTVYRFKGQQAPAIILTDVEPNQDRLNHAERLLFTAMTRATVRLELIIREGNSSSGRLMNV